MSRFSATLQRTASATLAVGAITAAASNPRRFKIYDVMFGSEAAPGDFAYLLQLQRCTTAGTATAVTPHGLDPADPIAAIEVGGQNHTANGTLTSGAFALSAPVHQRTSFRWAALFPGAEIVCPATASNGVHVMTLTAGNLVAVTADLHFEEL